MVRLRKADRKKKIINYSQMSISCGHVVRDFESEAKTTVWPSNVVLAEIVRRPPGDPPQGVSGFFWLNHW